MTLESTINPRHLREKYQSWVGQKVKANHAFAPGTLDKDGIKAVLDDTAKILP